MTSPPSSDFEFELQTLAGERVTPTAGLSTGDETRLTAAKRTLDQNYLEIEEYIEGDLASNPMFVCPQEKRMEEGFEVLRLLHNYLASLYSFNETIRVLFNQHSPEIVELTSSDFTPASGGTDESYYGTKLGFLRGLRTDFQHGGFSCLNFYKTGELGNFGGYHIIFSRQSFIEDSGLNSPSRFLRCTNENERQYPISFIGRFHRQALRAFYEDTELWFEQV